MEVTSKKDELHTGFILGDIVAGWEAGFSVPPAGQDREWMKTNASEFQKKAREGDENMQGLVQELKTRKEFQGILDAGSGTA